MDCCQVNFGWRKCDGNPEYNGRVRTMTFARELDELIRKHLATPVYGEDFMPILNALCDAADKLAFEADRYPWREKGEELTH